jgi:hypothetical protein
MLLVAEIEAGTEALAQGEKELRERASQAKSRAITFLRNESWCGFALAACLAGIALCCRKQESASLDQLNDAKSASARSGGRLQASAVARNSLRT